MALFSRKKPAPEPEPEPVVEEPLVRRTPEEHLVKVLDGVRPLRPFGMQIHDVGGLTLCEDIVSDLDLPMVSTALVDGYGVRAANIVGATEKHPIDLRVVGVVERSDTLPTQAVAPGGCVLVAVGAPVPKGVDAVVPLVDAQRIGRVVTFLGEAQLHQNVSLRGSVLADGAKLMASGTVLEPRAIAVLAEVGLDKVLVRPRPRLVVFSVGPDLVAPGLPITSINQRYASATSLLVAAARADGATVYPLESLGRDASVVRQALVDQAIRADAMVVAAQEDADARLVADLLAGLGEADRAHVTFNGGHLLVIGRTGDERVPVLVVPAGAGTAWASYHLWVRPLLRALGARGAVTSRTSRARLASAVPADADGVRYIPAWVEGDRVSTLGFGRELAYDVFRANALAVIPAGPALAGGAEVECLALGSGGTPPTASE